MGLVVQSPVLPAHCPYIQFGTLKGGGICYVHFYVLIAIVGEGTGYEVQKHLAGKCHINQLHNYEPCSQAQWTKKKHLFKLGIAMQNNASYFVTQLQLSTITHFFNFAIHVPQRLQYVHRLYSMKDRATHKTIAQLGIKPAMLVSSVQTVAACYITAPRICTLVLFITTISQTLYIHSECLRLPRDYCQGQCPTHTARVTRKHEKELTQ